MASSMLQYGADSQILPQELCDMVMDFAWDDTSTLRACSSVSRAWLPTCRGHIFSFVRLGNSEAITAFLAVVSSGVMDSSFIIHLVRDLCVGDDGCHRSVLLDARLVDLLKRFTSVETLRLEHLSLMADECLPEVAESIILLARKTPHSLHLHELFFDYYDDPVHLLCSSPRKSSVCITGTGYRACRAPVWIGIARMPVYGEVSISDLTANFHSYTHFFLTMRRAHVFRWPLSMTVDRLTFNDDEPDHTVGYITYPAQLGAIYISALDIYLDDCLEYAFNNGLCNEDFHSPITVLDILSVQINAPSILHMTTIFSDLLCILLIRGMLPTRRMHFIFDGLEPDDAVPAVCVDLDCALSVLLSKKHVEIVFDVQCPADRLGGWIGTILECFPTVIAYKTRTGMVCSMRHSPKGERHPVAQHWWP